MVKQSIRSPDEKARVMSHATIKIAAPETMEMDEREVVAFDDIIAEFANCDWSKHNIMMAAFLARATCQLEIYQKQLADEGMVISGPKGYPLCNPLVQGCKMLSANIMQFRRTLAIHAVAKGGTKEDRERRAANAREMQASLPENSGLLAMPREGVYDA